MQQTRIGELLTQRTNLSSHDVQEILAEQNATHRPFGQIALQWGLCQPEDLWRAWFEQLGRRTPTVNINKIGVDSRVLSVVPKQLAERYHVMPLRIFEGQVLLAIDHQPDEQLIDEIELHLGHEVKFVLADAGQIDETFHHYYLAA
jgi:type IV pilus assembly protein PilB